MSIAIRTGQDEYIKNPYQKDVEMEASSDGKNLDASRLNLCQDTDSQIAEKQGLAKKQAMKLISDAWERAQKNMSELDSAREAKSKVASEYHELQGYLSDIEKNKESLREEYGVEEDSQEQKDLELLEKYQDNKNGASYDNFSKEEIERLKELQGGTLTEYQKRALEMNQIKDSINIEIDRKKQKLIQLTGNISDMKSEILKSQDFENALKGAQTIMEASDAEIMGILYQEGKDYIEKEAEEAQEKSEKLQEKQEAQDERIEKTQEKKEALEERLQTTKRAPFTKQGNWERREQEELIRGENKVDQMTQNAAVKRITDSKIEEAQKGVQKIMENNLLINEDIKGIEIDLTF